jgi:hypothetical protein
MKTKQLGASQRKADLLNLCIERYFFNMKWLFWELSISWRCCSFEQFERSQSSLTLPVSLGFHAFAQANTIFGVNNVSWNTHCFIAAWMCVLKANKTSSIVALNTCFIICWTSNKFHPVWDYFKASRFNGIRHFSTESIKVSSHFDLTYLRFVRPEILQYYHHIISEVPGDTMEQLG